jgi:hypothetical protein
MPVDPSPVPKVYQDQMTTDDSLIGGPSSNLDTIRPPIDYENPYPSSTALHSNGGQYNASFMTSPSHYSDVEVPNYITEVCLPWHGRSL